MYLSLVGKSILYPMGYEVKGAFLKIPVIF
jgi:hypothetical protein